MTQTAAATTDEPGWRSRCAQHADELAREARLLDDPFADDPEFDSDFYQDV